MTTVGVHPAFARCGASSRTRWDAALESGGKCGLTISTRRMYLRDSTQTPEPALTIDPAGTSSRRLHRVDVERIRRVDVPVLRECR